MIWGLELTPSGGLAISTIQWLLVVVEEEGTKEGEVAVSVLDEQMQELKEEDKEKFKWFLFLLLWTQMGTVVLVLRGQIRRNDLWELSPKEMVGSEGQRASIAAFSLPR